MQHPSVRRFFKEQIRHYSRAGKSTDSLVVKKFAGWIKNKNIDRTLVICEFGGGAGQLLNELSKQYPKGHFINAEIVADYERYLVNKKITFINKSVLDSKIPDKSFDVLIIRDILHHLVGRNFDETTENQIKALMELRRLVKPRGVIFIDELTNESELAIRVIYYLSLINSKIGFNFIYNSNAIIAFLTSAKLLKLCKKIFGKKANYSESCYNAKVVLKSRLLHLGAKQRRVTLMIEMPNK